MVVKRHRGEHRGERSPHRTAYKPFFVAKPFGPF